MDIEDAKKKIKNLGHNYSPEELEEKAKKYLRATDKDLSVVTMFDTSEEKSLAKKFLNKYLDDYTIETIADKNTLKHLIYFEIIQQRLEKITNKVHGENKAVPLKYLDALHKNAEQITRLKETLGITHTKDSKKDSYQDLQILMKKFAIHRKENIAERTRVCPYCGELIHFIMKMDSYEGKKHPFFKGRFITNKHLLKLYKDEIITKEDVAKILEVSTDYIDWIIEKLKQNVT